MQEDKKIVPEKTVERLSLYRRILKLAKKEGLDSIFSHDIADRANTSAVIVRRDLMNVGYSGNSRHGYNIDNLLNCFHKFFNGSKVVNVAIIGLGHIGMAVKNYMKEEEVQLQFVAGFDTNKSKLIDENCFPIESIKEIIISKEVDTVVIAVPYSKAQEVANIVFETGVTSIVNFAPVRLKAPENVYVESIDITTLLEKSIYYGNIYKTRD